MFKIFIPQAHLAARARQVQQVWLAHRVELGKQVHQVLQVWGSKARQAWPGYQELRGSAVSVRPASGGPGARMGPGERREIQVTPAGKVQLDHQDRQVGTVTSFSISMSQYVQGFTMVHLVQGERILVLGKGGSPGSKRQLDRPLGLNSIISNESDLSMGC